MHLNEDQENYLQTQLGVSSAKTLNELSPEQRLQVANLGAVAKPRRGLDQPAPTTSFEEPRIAEENTIEGFILDSKKLVEMRPELRLEVESVFQMFRAAHIEQSMISEASMRNYSASDILRFRDRLKPYMTKVD